MSRQRAPSPPARGRRATQLLLAAVGLAGLVLSVFVLGPPTTGLPLDPTSVAADGVRGVVELLEDLEVDVTIDTEPPRTVGARAWLPVDALDTDSRAAWAAWVEEGGDLVVSDPTSELHDLARLGSDQLVGRGDRLADCERFADLGAVRQGDWQGLEVPAGARGCFPVGQGTGAWLVELDRGAGRLTVLGSTEPFTNALLDAADNAVLAAALLGPAPGERLVVVPRPAEPAETGGLLALIPTGVWQLLALLVLALLLAVVWQGRRDGVVVAESLPPVLPSAELARSLAGLLQRAGDRTDAAERLRRGHRRRAARTLGLSPELDPPTLAHEVARRTAVSRDDAELALLPGAVPDDAALVAVAAAGHRLRRDLTHPPEHDHAAT
ncbi:MAG: DUF4350 domain-containing protein [Nitriliruptoraceae bacterium]